MGTGISLTGTSNMNDVIRELTRTQREVINLKDKLRQTGNTGKKAQRDIGGAFGGRAISDIRNYATALTGAGGVLAAFRLVSAEIRQIVDLQNKAAGAQVTLSSARKDLLRNLVGLSEASQREVLQIPTAISRQTGVSEGILSQALAATVSATGQDIPLSEASVRLAARFLADKPESIAEFAGSLADIARVTKQRDPSVNLGFITQVGALSRITDPSLQAANIPTALVGAAEFGATPQEAASLFAALSGAGVDPTGRRTGTATIQLSRQLEEFFTEDKKILRRKRQQGFEGQLTLGERIAFLQAEPKTAERFLEDASFETKAVGPIRSLIRGAPGKEGIQSIAETFKANLEKFPAFDALKTLGEKSIAARELDPLEAQARLQRLGQVTTEALLTGNLAAGTAGVTRQLVTDVLKATGTSAIGEKALRATFELGSGLGQAGPVEVGIDVLNKRLKALESRRELIPPVIGGGFPAVSAIAEQRREPTSEELRQSNLLESAVTELREINASLRAGQSTESAAPSFAELAPPIATSAIADGDTE